MSTGQVFAMGSDTPSGWAALEIAFYKMTFSADGGLEFTFMKDSGVVENGDIAGFIAGLLAGKIVGLKNLIYFDNAPNIFVRKACYVVLQLDPGLNCRFMSAMPGFMTDENLADHYFGLVHVGDDGSQTPGKAPPEGKPCHIAYFGVDTSPAEQGRVDPFNLYAEFDIRGGQTLPVILDPDIKNDGTNPNWPP
jgi:hypothetical protein